MLRYRRYRVFLAFAVIALFALYHFGNSGASWRSASAKSGQSKSEGPKGAALSWKPHPQIAHETSKLDFEIPATKTSPARQTPPPIAPIGRPVEKLPPALSKQPVSKSVPDGTSGEGGDGKSLIEGGVGRVEVTPLSTTVEPIHWKKQSEHFPLPSQSIIQLPTGAAKPIPKIQFDFKKESAAAKADREAKLEVIRGVFKRSWKGYREHAWLQDELSPVSGKFRNPFASWGATLVDALDTLWIMGMKEEFAEAAKAVDQIDFTTTPRGDIPLFETTIRYLGGFIAAYDLSNRKYKNLLEKAVELAELLISAFDTPNRMPQTYYYWRPAFSSQTHRASNRIVLAEIGSLSVEFTRLAQLTGEHKYYDAIARITDNLEEFQNKTRLPGMWPTYLDASGCKRIDYTTIAETPLQAPLEVSGSLKDTPLKAAEPTTTEELSPLGNKYIPLNLPPPIVLSVLTDGTKPSPAPLVAGEPGKARIQNWDQVTGEKLSPMGNKYKSLELPPPIVFAVETGSAKPSPTTLVAGQAGKAKIQNWDKDSVVGDLSKGSTTVKKRQLDEPGSVQDAASPVLSSTSAPASPTPERPECEDQGFVSSSDYGSEEYTLGGMSDSTYEYLPKEWLLLGGRIDKYRTMYEYSADTVKNNLIFRPMLPNGDDILFSGKLNVPSSKPEDSKGILEGENAHLTCFAGGMFGMGAKIFNRPADLELAKKLTEGCVWSYNMTSTGIMPEAFFTIPCESTKGCAWNETKYRETVDPGAEARLTSFKSQMETYRQQMASASAWYEAQLAEMTAAPSSTSTGLFAVEAMPTLSMGGGVGLVKRQLDAHPPTIPHQGVPQRAPSRNLMVEGEVEGESEEAEGPPSPPTPAQAEGSAQPSPTVPVFPDIYSPLPPLDHDAYVKHRIEEERLPAGVTHVQARSYILRPEAIESVWYMYRITGDPHWREAGWRMFEAVNKHTSTVYGNSAIDDVTKTAPELSDEMESFWLAETMKYFYLLFADEGVVSLDEWVLNTEAHPFRRPT